MNSVTQEKEIERRLTLLEERQATARRDLSTIAEMMKQIYSLESNVAVLTQLYPRLLQRVDAMDGDMKKMIVGGLLAAVSILGQYAVLKIGL